MSTKQGASPLDFLFQFFTSLMLNLNIYQIIALLFKYFRASLCKVILEFQDFAFCCFFFYIFSALFFSTARQFDVSLLVTLACEPSLFFPFTPFQNCFHVSHFEIADVVDVEIPSLTPFAPSKL